MLKVREFIRHFDQTIFSRSSPDLWQNGDAVQCGCNTDTFAI
jgi:hypothetical protein